jgi:transcriptional regulator with GAF, ATPase, and Fis domain
LVLRDLRVGRLALLLGESDRGQAKEQSMSATSNAVTPVTGTTAMDPNLYGVDEPMARKTERAETSFMETIVGRCGGLRSILSEVEVVAPTDATVLITGETGTGKGVIAQAIHELSPRRTRNLVKLNCTAMPAGLLEGELFGHERGAFTGAIASRSGRLTLADGGTLFLDGIGDMPLELQPKLLRLLQESEFETVGSTAPREWMFDSSPQRIEICGKWFTIGNFEKIYTTG